MAVERYIAVYHPLYYNKVEIFKLLLNIEDVLSFQDTVHLKEVQVLYVCDMVIWTLSNYVDIRELFCGAPLRERVHFLTTVS